MIFVSHASHYLYTSIMLLLHNLFLGLISSALYISLQLEVFHSPTDFYYLCLDFMYACFSVSKGIGKENIVVDRNV